MSAQMTRFLHLPLKILWCDVNEWSLLFGCYIVAMKAGGITWFLIPLAIFFAIPHLREMNRGGLKHICYEYGWLKIKGYPYSTMQVFHE